MMRDTNLLGREPRASAKSTAGKPQDAADRATATARRRWKRRVVVVAVVLAVAAGVQWRRELGVRASGRWYAYQAGGPAIGVDEAIARLRTGEALVVDVRDRAEYDTSHLAGSRWLALAALERDGWPADWPRDRLILTYCTIGYRSGVASKLLADQGMRALNIRGGVLALAHAGETFEDSRGETRRIHIWDSSYAWLVPPGYTSVVGE